MIYLKIHEIINYHYFIVGNSNKIWNKINNLLKNNVKNYINAISNIKNKNKIK